MIAKMISVSVLYLYWINRIHSRQSTLPERQTETMTKGFVQHDSHD